MFSRIFNIDFNRLVLLNMMPDMRQAKFVAWLQCLITPVKVIYGEFNNNRSANLYNLAHNGQVCYLRKVLNDTFDPDLRRITIGEGNRYTREYIYTSGEEQKKYLGKIYLRQNIDFADTGVDFRVIIPIGFDLNAVSPRMKATIEYYKLASKRYKIEYDE